MSWLPEALRRIARIPRIPNLAEITEALAVIPGAFDQVTGWISSLARTVDELRGEIWEVLRPGVSSLWDEIAKIWDRIDRIVIPNIDPLRGLIEEVRGKVWDYVIPEIDLLWDSIRELWDKLRGYRIPELWRRLGDLRLYFDRKIDWLFDLIRARYRDLYNRLGDVVIHFDRRVGRICAALLRIHHTLIEYRRMIYEFIPGRLFDRARRILDIERFLEPVEFWMRIERGVAGFIKDTASMIYEAIMALIRMVVEWVVSDFKRDYDPEKMEPVEPFKFLYAELLNEKFTVE